MFCKECGKKIDDDSQFCSYCGKKLQEGSQEKDNACNIQSDIEFSEFYKLLLAKIELMPKYLTNRGGIYSDAIFLCDNNGYELKNIKDSFSLHYEKQDCYIINKEAVPECFKSAITYAISDYDDINEGDFFYVGITENRKYLRSINCIVQVFKDYYEYIIGIVHHY